MKGSIEIRAADLDRRANRYIKYQAKIVLVERQNVDRQTRESCETIYLEPVRYVSTMQITLRDKYVIGVELTWLSPPSAVPKITTCTRMDFGKKGKPHKKRKAKTKKTPNVS